MKHRYLLLLIISIIITTIFIGCPSASVRDTNEKVVRSFGLGILDIPQTGIYPPQVYSNRLFSNRCVPLSDGADIKTEDAPSDFKGELEDKYSMKLNAEIQAKILENNELKAKFGISALKNLKFRVYFTNMKVYTVDPVSIAFASSLSSSANCLDFFLNFDKSGNQLITTTYSAESIKIGVENVMNKELASNLELQLGDKFNGAISFASSMGNTSNYTLSGKNLIVAYKDLGFSILTGGLETPLAIENLSLDRSKTLVKNFLGVNALMLSEMPNSKEYELRIYPQEGSDISIKIQNERAVATSLYNRTRITFRLSKQDDGRFTIFISGYKINFNANNS